VWPRRGQSDQREQKQPLRLKAAEQVIWKPFVPSLPGTTPRSPRERSDEQAPGANPQSPKADPRCLGDTKSPAVGPETPPLPQVPMGTQSPEPLASPAPAPRSTTSSKDAAGTPSGPDADLAARLLRLAATVPLPPSDELAADGEDGKPGSPRVAQRELSRRESLISQLWRTLSEKLGASASGRSPSPTRHPLARLETALSIRNLLREAAPPYTSWEQEVLLSFAAQAEEEARREAAGTDGNQRTEGRTGGAGNSGLFPENGAFAEPWTLPGAANPSSPPSQAAPVFASCPGPISPFSFGMIKFIPFAVYPKPFHLLYIQKYSICCDIQKYSGTSKKILVLNFAVFSAPVSVLLTGQARVPALLPHPPFLWLPAFLCLSDAVLLSAFLCL
jgi:hypothetical protein